jgi:hypothetical protein
MEIIGTVWIIGGDEGHIAKTCQMGVNLAERFSDVLFVNKCGNLRMGMPNEEFNGTTTPISPGTDNPDPYFIHIKALLIVIFYMKDIPFPS